MKNNKMKFIFTVILISSSLMFTGCIEEIKEKFNFAKSKVEKIIHPMPKCSDAEVVMEVNRKLSKDALYGTHAQVKYGTILLNKIDEQTGAKSCRAVVKYSIDKKDNEISSFLSKVPVFKNVSKDRTIKYTIYRHPKANKNLTFLISID